MPIKVKKNPKNYYYHILTYIALFLILTVTLVTVLLFFNYNNFVLSILYSYSRDNLSQISHSADFMVESANTVLKQLYFDSSINQLIYNVSENTPELLDSLTRLNNYVSAATNIESVYIYNSSQSKISYAIRNKGTGVENVKDFFDKNILKNISSNTFTNISPISRITGASEQFASSGNNVYTFMLTDNNNSSNTLDGAIILNFSSDWLYKTINLLDKSPQNTTIIINKKGYVMSSNSTFPFLSNKSKDGFIRNILASKETSGYFITNLNGTRAFVTYVSSDKPDWIFVKITPYASIVSFLNNLRMLSILLYLVILIIGIISSVFISRKLFKPYSYINDQLKSLESKMRNSLYLCKQDFFKRLLNDSDSLPYVTIRKKFNEFDVRLEEGKDIRVILFKIDRYSEFCNKYNFNDRNLLKYSIANISSEIFGEYCTSEAVVTDSDHVLLVFSADDIGFLQPAVKKVQECISNYLELSCSAAASSAASSPEHINQLYSEALDASNYRFFAGHGCIVDTKDSSTMKNIDFIYPENKEKQLSDSIMLGKINDAKRHYDEIILTLKGYSYNTFIQTITRLALSVSITSDTLEKSHDFPLRFKFGTFITEVGKSETIEEINNIFNEFFEDLAENINEKKNKKHDKLIESAIKIINEEYSDLNLSLENLSDKLNMSSSHLRHIFKRNTNKSLSDFILEVRMNKAKELLKATTLSINEIAERTGFLNSSYFYTAFKKINGITPNTFRQK